MIFERTSARLSRRTGRRLAAALCSLAVAFVPVTAHASAPGAPHVW
ncbi:hypothetical protein ACWEPI_21855 [Streptomyces sp. NPDC004262]